MYIYIYIHTSCVYIHIHTHESICIYMYNDRALGLLCLLKICFKQLLLARRNVGSEDTIKILAPFATSEIFA